MCSKKCGNYTMEVLQQWKIERMKKRESWKLRAEWNSLASPRSSTNWVEHSTAVSSRNDIWNMMPFNLNDAALFSPSVSRFIFHRAESRMLSAKNWISFFLSSSVDSSLSHPHGIVMRLFNNVWEIIFNSHWWKTTVEYMFSLTRPQSRVTTDFCFALRLCLLTFPCRSEILFGYDNKSQNKTKTSLSNFSGRRKINLIFSFLKWHSLFVVYFFNSISHIWWNSLAESRRVSSTFSLSPLFGLVSQTTLGSGSFWSSSSLLFCYPTETDHRSLVFPWKILKIYFSKP